MSSKKDVVLVFPAQSAGSTGPVRRGLVGDVMKEFAVKVEDVANWFSDFEIDSIELTISAGAETGDLTKLIVSAKGEGGMTITLKPKKSAT